MQDYIYRRDSASGLVLADNSAITAEYQNKLHLRFLYGIRFILNKLEVHIQSSRARRLRSVKNNIKCSEKDKRAGIKIKRVTEPRVRIP